MDSFCKNTGKSTIQFNVDIFINCLTSIQYTLYNYCKYIVYIHVLYVMS